MIESIRMLIKYRELLFMITWRDIRVKYKQSLMGFMWAILMPMIIILSGILVRYGMAKLSGSQLNMTQIISVSVKAIPWAFFISSIRFATNSLTGNRNLVTKIYFPKEIIPLSAVLSQLFDLMIASGPLIIILAFAGTRFSFQLLWILPLLLIMTVLAIALGIFLSAANLFFRDVKYIVDIITSFAIFFTPVFYDASLAGKWRSFLLINPVAPLLEGLISSIVLQRPAEIGWVLYSALVSTIGLYLSMVFFKNIEPKFAENI
jgi:ABC-type polysaccharide/polyol phosphate export permease